MLACKSVHRAHPMPREASASVAFPWLQQTPPPTSALMTVYMLHAVYRPDFATLVQAPGIGSDGSILAFLGVYDGHGGLATSDWLQKNLYGVVKSQWSVSAPEKTMDKAFREADSQLLAPGGWMGMGERGIGGSKCGSTAAVACIFQVLLDSHLPQHRSGCLLPNLQPMACIVCTTCICHMMCAWRWPAHHYRALHTAFALQRRLILVHMRSRHPSLQHPQ